MSVNHTIIKKEKKKTHKHKSCWLSNKLIHFGDHFIKYKLRNGAYSYMTGSTDGDVGCAHKWHQNVV